MADAKFQATDAVIKEVMMPVIENFAKTEAALLTTGLATDASATIEWARGGRHVTRPEFRGNVQVNRLRATNEKQKVSYEDVKYPLVSSIVSIQYEGEAVEDAFDDKGFINRVTDHIKEKLVEDLDKTLISYTADIGDGSTNYGANGATLALDISAEADPTLTFDALVRAVGKFGDARGATVLLANSKVITDLLITTEAKNLQQGVVIGNQMGVYFPTLGCYALKSDRIEVATATYTNLLCRPGCMSYGWKNPLSIIPKYEGDYIWTLDFVWRFAIMRNPFRGSDAVCRVLTKTNQS